MFSDNLAQKIPTIECSLRPDSCTEAENFDATYLVERQAKEKQAALKKTENKKTDAFLAEMKAEAKQNSAQSNASRAS